MGVRTAEVVKTAGRWYDGWWVLGRPVGDRTAGWC